MKNLRQARTQKHTSFLVVILFLTCSFDAVAQSGGISWNLDHRYNSAIIERQDEFYRAVDSLFRNRQNYDYLKDHFSDSAMQKWGEGKLMYDLYYAGIYYNNDAYYKPTLLGIMDVVAGEKYLAKVAFISRDDSSHNSIQAIYNWLASYDSVKKKFVFECYTDWYTRDWFKTTIGNISYLKQSKETFSAEEANAMNRFNDSLAHLFQQPVKKFTYYSCRDPFQMHNVRGTDYVPNMFYARNGAIIENRVIFSASNTEFYPHELVHEYLNEMSPAQISRLANEGIASYLGGSGGLSYTQLMGVLKKYVLDQNISPTSLLPERSMKSIDADVSTLYAIGALVSKLIFDKKGLEGWKQFVAIPEADLVAGVSALLEVKREDMDAYLKKQLMKY